MNYFLCILLGYLLGSISFSYIIGKFNGIDIRDKGSTNAGASNTTIVLGWRFGIMVAIGDIAKAAIAVILAKTFFPEIAEAGFLAGVSCVIGHIYPFYLQFRGGKGFASYMGMILALDWKCFIVLSIAMIIVTVVTNYIAIATISTALIYPLYLFITGISLIVLVIFIVLGIIILFKHVDNIKRIINNEETKLREASKF